MPKTLTEADKKNAIDKWSVTLNRLKLAKSFKECNIDGYCIDGFLFAVEFTGGKVLAQEEYKGYYGGSHGESSDDEYSYVRVMISYKD